MARDPCWWYVSDDPCRLLANHTKLEHVFAKERRHISRRANSFSVYCKINKVDIEVLLHQRVAPHNSWSTYTRTENARDRRGRTWKSMMWRQNGENHFPRWFSATCQHSKFGEVAIISAIPSMCTIRSKAYVTMIMNIIHTRANLNSD